MEDEKINKIEIRVVNEQNSSNLDFKEPEWMKILKVLLEKNQQQKTIKSINA